MRGDMSESVFEISINISVRIFNYYIRSDIGFGRIIDTRIYENERDKNRGIAPNYCGNEQRFFWSGECAGSAIFSV